MHENKNMTVAPRKKHRSSLSAPCLYTLHIALCPVDLKPLIWRRVVVDGRISLAKLHHVIQAAFGWSDVHMHDFEIRDNRYALPHPDDAMWDEIESEDSRKAYLNRLLAEGDTFLYRYDFGDGWDHVITVQHAESCEDDPHGSAWVDDGARACPPEDVGGVPGYLDLVATLRDDPGSEEAQSLLHWLGDDGFDPELFDRRAANATIIRMLSNGWAGK